VTKPSNRTLSLHRLTSNFSSATNIPWLSPIDSSLNPHSGAPIHCSPGILRYIASGRTSRKTLSRARMSVHWPVLQHWTWSGSHRKHLSFLSRIVIAAFFEPLPSSGSIRHNTNVILRFVRIPVNQQSNDKQNGETFGNSYTEVLYLLGHGSVYM
jgi:hypothetical protein